MKEARLKQIEHQLKIPPTAVYTILAKGGQIGGYRELARELVRALKAAHKKRK